MSLPNSVSSRVLARIGDRLRLAETRGRDGGPFMTFRSPMSPEPVGAMRVFRGASVDRVVAVSLVVPAIKLDSHMIFAFTPPSSLVPHFTLDAVSTGAFFAFHLDLIPRADLAAHVVYMNATLEPLTSTFESAQKVPGLSPAHLTPRQRALMSPWMLAFRADAAAFEASGKAVDEYLTHWFSLVERGVPDDVVRAMPPTSAEGDRATRAALFSPEIDPVWSQVDRLLGVDASAQIREVLKGSEVTP